MFRLLLVDDNAAIVEGISEILREFEYEVVEALSGQAALDILKSDEGGFALMICDIRMPKMGGLELLENIQQILEPTKIPRMLFFSADANPVELKQIKDASVPTDFIRKPFEIPEFLQMVETLLSISKSVL